MQTQKAAELGPRERGKNERKRRIIRAARDVFLERGYDEATTREIAVRAEVATGTLFVYAAEKRDLLFLVLNDELDEQFAGAFSSVESGAPLLEQLLGIFAEIYEYFSRNVKLGRFALREMAHYTSPPIPCTAQALQLRERRRFVQASLVELIRKAQDSGEIDSKAPRDLLASMFVAIYGAEIRGWLNTALPNVEAGVERLRQQFTIVFEGLGPGRTERTALRGPKSATTPSRKTSRTARNKRLPR